MKKENLEETVLIILFVVSGSNYGKEAAISPPWEGPPQGKRIPLSMEVRMKEAGNSKP